MLSIQIKDQSKKNRISDRVKKEPFFCSICNETKSSLEDRIKCSNCARLICKSCLSNLEEVEVIKCPYCFTNLDLDSNTLNHSIITEFLKRGVEKMQQNDFSQAEEIFKQVLKINPNSYKAWKRLGLLYFQKKNWELAAFCLSKVLKLNPHDYESKKKYIEADFRNRSYY